MRILLAQNSQYYPAHGGGDKSNRLLLEALAARGHECSVLARAGAFGAAEHRRYLEELAARGVTPSVEDGVVRFGRAGVDVRVVTDRSLRAYFIDTIETFRPRVILASTDDPAQLLLEPALSAEQARVVYLARATLALPFGPDSAFPSPLETARIRGASAVVGVSEYVAGYIRRYAGIEAVHVPISLVEREDWPELGRFENEFVTLVNPCAVKGIAIFLELADAFPGVRFAAVPTWGANQEDLAALQSRRNITVLAPVDRIEELLARTRVLLVPSLWAEARSRIVLESMLCAVPVMASRLGGLPEAKMGVPYLLPVNPIVKYQPRLDERMVPVAEVPPQDIGPWREALERLLTDRAHYEDVSRRSRAAALAYAGNLSVAPFEALLEKALRGERKEFSPQPAGSGAGSKAAELSPEKRRLLALRLRKRAPAAAWFPGAEGAAQPRLFCFPHAGGGAAPPIGGLACATVCPVLLPGREVRIAEAPFTRMGPLVSALADAMEGYLALPFAFFGHSMGAVVAFELARELRRRGKPMPRILIASGARAPHYRRDYTPPAPAPEAQFLEELRGLAGIPVEVLEDAASMRALLPALRADAELYRHYVYTGDAPLACPLRAYGGEDDRNVRHAHLEGWAGETTGDFRIRTFPGGHFYLRDETVRRQAEQAVQEDLRIVW